MFQKATSTLIFVVAATSAAFAQSEDARLRKEVQNVYSQWDKFVGKGDLKGMFSLIHPTFKQYDADGKMKTYTQTKTEMEAMKSWVKEPKSLIKVDNVYRDGDEIVAWVTMHVSFKMDSGGGKWTTTSFTGKFVETFKRFDGRLLFVQSQMLPQ